MDLPPSGWYPDPYRVPGLLRWWDGSTWTHHTHPGGGAGEAESAGPAATVQQAAVGPTAVQQAAVQQAAVGSTAVQPGAESASVPSTTVQPAVQATTVPPTSVQPAVQATTVQPATVPPTTVQPAPVQPTMVQPGVAGLAGGPAGGPDANGTQVLFLGEDAWAGPENPDPAAQASHILRRRCAR